MPSTKKFLGNVQIDGDLNITGNTTGEGTFPGGGGGGSVDSVNTKTGAVVLHSDDISDSGHTHKFTTAAEISKLSGIASGATANDTDSNLKSRANHTGVQAQSTVTNLVTDLAAKAATTHTHAITEVEVDFGSVPCGPKCFTVNDAAITAASKVIAAQSGAIPTGGFGGEAELDPILFTATPGSGSMVICATPLAGRVLGKFKVNYQIG